VFSHGVTSHPPLGDYDITRGRTYLYLTNAPLYAFGHGLSYTAFEYGPLQVDPPAVGTGGVVNVTVAVRNVGPRDGDEVVQLYVRAVEPRVPRPLQQLRGFRRVRIARGTAATVTLPIAAADLATWDEAAGGWRSEPGAYEARVGASSADIRQTGRFRVER